MPFIQWLGMILLIVLALLTIIPFLWMVSASFKA
ncbi:TPA: carbohydrate ABC transporter permease, partial [Enterococcus faecium]|nr:carbohydrate ABC transporter permease [Enterococcus faecium]HAQ1514867.1 carbohydrate ABC transporter permease [Enterococcus faecium]